MTSSLSCYVHKTIDTAITPGQVTSDILAVFNNYHRTKGKQTLWADLCSTPSVLSIRSGLTGGTRCTAFPELRKACEAFWTVPCLSPSLLRHV